MELKETNHSYYCECWESGRTMEYDSWKEFKTEGLDYDLDYNLLFRYDIEEDCKYDEECNEIKLETYTLKLHHALQRHGYEQWHVAIHNIEQEDMKEIEEHLIKAKKHLLEMWKEIEEEK